VKYFKLEAKDEPIDRLLPEINENHDCWFVDRTRQESIDKQRETHAIALRAHAGHARQDSRVRRAKPFAYIGRPSPMCEKFPVTDAYAERLINEKRGKAGRVVLTMLRPNGTIYPHTDDGMYWLLRDRYHLVIKSKAGSLFRAGGEEVRMQEGELWWFDPTAEHEAFNDSDDDRIHLIIDVLSAESMRTFRRRIMRSPWRATRAALNAAIRSAAWPLRQKLLGKQAYG
jgi:hypothetical protein